MRTRLSTCRDAFRWHSNRGKQWRREWLPGNDYVSILFAGICNPDGLVVSASKCVALDEHERRHPNHNSRCASSLSVPHFTDDLTSP